jgi:HSP20 family protein
MNAVAEKPKQQNPVAERPFVAPDVNIYETENQFVLQAEMPGVTKEGLEVTLENNVLTLSGRRAEESTKGNLLYREVRPANFQRTFELDPSVDSEKISASIHQGILTVTLPKAERAKPRKIVIE